MMIAGVLQFEPAWGVKDANFKKIESLCRNAKLDLLVLPELSTTGYLFLSKKELSSHAEEFPGGETSSFLQELSIKTGGFVVAGVAEKDEGIFYNSAVLFGRKGHMGTYRKVHLFSTEKKVFEPGNLGFPVFDIGVAKVGMMVCFDWIFPEAARTLALSGADIIAHPSNLVMPYCPDAASTRALENNVFYLLSNRTGEERRKTLHLKFIGSSRIIGTKGEVLSSADKEERLLSCKIDPQKARIKRITPQNDLFSDRRSDQYKL